MSWQLGRRTSNLQDLLNLSSDALALERVGVSPDSVQHLVQLLNQAQIPLTNDAIPSSKLTQNGSFLSSFDFAPSGGHFYNVTRERPMAGTGRRQPVDHGGSGPRRRHAQLRRHAPGSPLRVLLRQLPRQHERLDPGERDAGQSVHRASVGDGPRQLDLPRRQRRHLEPPVRRQHEPAAQLAHAEHRAAERAVVDQPRQQAPLQVRRRLPLQSLLAGQHDEPFRDVHVQLDSGFRGRRAGELQPPLAGQRAVRRRRRRVGVAR